MTDAFALCLEFVLDREAGYVDDVRDPGGATNMGITIQTLANWRRKSVTKSDVRNLTIAEAADIYRANYWNQSHCDSFHPALALVLFDSAVNSGNYRAATFLQEAVRTHPDGRIGPETIREAGHADLKTVIETAILFRLQFLKTLQTWPVFGKGWEERLHILKATAFHMAGIRA